MYFLLFFFQADSLKKSLKGSSGNGGGGCSLDSKMQQVKELEDEVKDFSKFFLFFLHSCVQKWKTGL